MGLALARYGPKCFAVSVPRSVTTSYLPARLVHQSLIYRQVNLRLSTAVTHIIFKDGSDSTLAWYRRQEQDDKPYVVGVGWLLKSKKGNERLDEAEFAVDITVVDLFQKVCSYCRSGLVIVTYLCAETQEHGTKESGCVE